MPLSAPRLRIVSPAGTIPFGRGFYQLEEEILYLPVEYPGEKPKFFSFIESETVSIQCDNEGRLIFIELTLPRRHWIERADISFPDYAEPADIRFLDFRQKMNNPMISCDRYRQNIHIEFSPLQSVSSFHLAKNLIAEVSADNYLIGIWATDFVDDIAGREISAWRKSIRAAKNQAVAVY